MATKRDNQQKNGGLVDFPEGLAQPAIRALTGAGYSHLEELREVTEAEVMALHGIGKNAMDKLRAALQAKGWAFADKKKSGE